MSIDVPSKRETLNIRIKSEERNLIDRATSFGYFGYFKFRIIYIMSNLVLTVKEAEPRR